MSNDLYSTTPDDEIVEQCARCKKWLTNYEVHPKYQCDEYLLVRAETAEADNAKLRGLVAKLIEVSDVLAEYTDENAYVWESGISKAVEDWRALGIEYKTSQNKPEV